MLVRLEEVPAVQVRDVYKLLLDDSYAVRHAAAELVTDMLEESGQRHLAQVITRVTVVLVVQLQPFLQPLAACVIFLFLCCKRLSQPVTAHFVTCHSCQALCTIMVCRESRRLCCA